MTDTVVVSQLAHCNLSDDLGDVPWVVGDPDGREVSVLRHPTRRGGGHQHAALERHPLGVVRDGQATQKPFDAIDDQQPSGRAAVIGACEQLQLPVDLSCAIDAHARITSSAWCICRAPPSSRASALRRSGSASSRAI